MVGPFDGNSMKILSIKCSRARMGPLPSEMVRPLNGSQSKPGLLTLICIIFVLLYLDSWIKIPYTAHWQARSQGGRRGAPSPLEKYLASLQYLVWLRACSVVVEKIRRVIFSVCWMFWAHVTGPGNNSPLNGMYDCMTEWMKVMKSRVMGEKEGRIVERWDGLLDGWV